MSSSIAFVYVSDLHGNEKRYNEALSCCVSNNIRILHIGADILPKGSGILENQKRFVKGFLRKFFDKASEVNVTVLCHFGNDDIYTRKKYFDYSTLLDEVPFSSDGYKFEAYGYVPDYPFGLKTACKYDSQVWTPPTYISTPVEVGDAGFYPIDNIRDYFMKKGTIQDDLIDRPSDKQTIISIHCPPAGLGLDVCIDGRRVGSNAINSWISFRQPLLVLCGHIHESPDMTNIWYNNIGSSIIVQPGNKKIIIIKIQDQKVELLPA